MSFSLNIQIFPINIAVHVLVRKPKSRQLMQRCHSRCSHGQMLTVVTAEQEASLKKIIVEDYRAVGSLNDSFQSSNFLLLLLFFIDFGQW